MHDFAGTQNHSQKLIPKVGRFMYRWIFLFYEPPLLNVMQWYICLLVAADNL